MIDRVGVVGAGTMGAGIAQLAAVAGSTTMLFDVRRDLAETGKARVATALRKLAAAGKLAGDVAEVAIARITPTDRLADLAVAGFVVEAAPEQIELKRSLFSELGRLCAADAILATNTSSLSVGEIALAASHPERVGGMHFFNPAPVMPLVEVVRARATAETTVARVVEVARAWGKTPVHVLDTPGFIVNRVARPFYLETFRMLEEGVAPIEVIDAALEGAGFRMGPGRLLDLIGIDVNWAVTRAVYEGFGRAPRFEPHPLQRRMVEEGRLGRKSGRGFYDYAPDAPGSPARAAEVDRALAASVVDRVVGCIVNEAALALGDAIASAADIDLAMKLGTNYPKGPLAWGEEIGPARIVSLLRALGAAHPERYPIAPRLLDGNLR